MSISADGNDSWIIADIVSVYYISKQLTYESKYQLTKKRILVWWPHLHFFFVFEMWVVVSCCLCVKVAYRPHPLPTQIVSLSLFACAQLKHASFMRALWQIEQKEEQKLKKPHTFRSSLLELRTSRYLIGHLANEKNLWCSKDSIACKAEEIFFSALCFSVLICVAWGWPHLINDARWES